MKIFLPAICVACSLFFSAALCQENDLLAFPPPTSPGTAPVASVSQCVIREEAVQKVTEYINKMARQHEQYTNTAVPQSTKDSYFRLIMDWLARNFRFVEKAADCPAGMTIYHGPAQ
jgi:hypothetical protein